MRIFAGEWVRTWLTRLGMKDGEAIESKMVSRRIEGAQKKVEERNFEIRKNLLEYDEVMDEQRKRVYQYRQNILDGANCKELILEMIDTQVEQQLEEFLARDFGTESYAAWAGGRLNIELDNRDFRGMDFPSAESFTKDQAERMAAGQVLDLIEETLPVDEESREWNWAALAKIVNTRWQLSLRDRDLKKIGRDALDEFLIDKARIAIDKVDLGDGAGYLEKDYGLRTAIEWVQYKFGIALQMDEYQNIEIQAFKDRVLETATRMYEQREIEFPVMAGLIHFTTRDSGSGQRYDREQLVDWARDRFNVELDLDDLRNRQRDEIRKLLIEQSRTDYALGQQTEQELQRQLELLRNSDTPEPETATALQALTQWCKQHLGYQSDDETLSRLSEAKLEQTLTAALHDRFCPEMRRMERSLTLQILDAAWKDHLLAMDHLRSSVGLRGYAQVDPKVEYKREGMRTFEAMWHSIQERVTDLIFRMEQLDDDFVGSTWVETHDDAQSAVEMAREQSESGGEEVVSSERIEPIRNRDKRIGRNAPCPCGSGKKYKNCCMRSGSSAQQPVKSG